MSRGEIALLLVLALAALALAATLRSPWDRLPWPGTYEDPGIIDWNQA